MKFTEALEIVGKNYAPGVVNYYSKLTPDPWQKAHDELESIVLTKDKELERLACDAFVSRCKHLIERFQREAITSPINPVDAFVVGDPERLNRLRSRIDRACIYCESKTNLTLMPSEEDRFDMAIVCRSCAGQIRSNK